MVSSSPKKFRSISQKMTANASEVEIAQKKSFLGVRYWNAGCCKGQMELIFGMGINWVPASIYPEYGADSLMFWCEIGLN